jgi:hypothetical protein
VHASGQARARAEGAWSAGMGRDTDPSPLDPPVPHPDCCLPYWRAGETFRRLAPAVGFGFHHHQAPAAASLRANEVSARRPGVEAPDPQHPRRDYVIR